MSYIGDVRLGTTLYTTFTTVNASGVPTTLGNSPVVTIYQNANTTGITAGITLAADFSSKTGLNSVTVIATSSVTGFASGGFYSGVITTGTVSGVSMVGYKVFEFSIAGRSNLMPTTGGNTLDVNTNGEAGIDWGNIGNQSTSVSLSSTTLFTTTNVTNGVNANVSSVGTVVPANVTAYSTAIAANVTSQSTVINANVTAISTVVNANVTSISTVVNANVTSISTLVNANVTSITVGVVSSIQSGLATPTNITAGVITTVTNLTNAPTNGDLTSTMKTSVENAVWDATAASHNTAGTMGNKLNSAASAGDPWSTALPGAYGAGTAGNIVGNNLNATITSRMATYTQPTGFLAATFPATVASTTNITGGTITTVTNLTNAPTSGDLTSTMKTSVENAVWDATAASHNTAGTTGNKLNSAASAGDPWTTSLPGAYGAGTAGFIVGTNLDTTVSSRSTYAGGAVASVTAPVTVGTNNDKTGYTLSAAGITAVWAEVMTGTTTAVQAMRGFIAALMGKASGLDLNTPKYRNIADSKNVISATTDVNGNRTSVTLDLS